MVNTLLMLKHFSPKSVNNLLTCAVAVHYSTVGAAVIHICIAYAVLVYIAVIGVGAVYMLRVGGVCCVVF